LYEVGQSFSGCLGARLTGAGFGGSGIALLEENKFDAFQEDVLKAVKERGFPTPCFHRVEIGDGVEVYSVFQPAGETGNP
jgi:galactokinase